MDLLNKGSRLKIDNTPFKLIINKKCTFWEIQAISTQILISDYFNILETFLDIYRIII